MKDGVGKHIPTWCTVMFEWLTCVALAYEALGRVRGVVRGAASGEVGPKGGMGGEQGCGEEKEGWVRVVTREVGKDRDRER